MKQVRRISPDLALEMQRQGATLFDTRAEEERALGWARGSVPTSRGIPLPGEAPVLLICERGRRSLALAEQLVADGHSNVCSVDGGFMAWREADLPVDYPEGLDAAQRDRYARQLVLPQVGPAGQVRLGQSRITLIGAGGLGSPAALYLAAAGVGRLRIVDDDQVARSNLHRQVLHGESALGEAKTRSAMQRLGDLNPDVQLEPMQTRVDGQNVERLLEGSEVVIDGSDNFPTRYLLNDACLKLGIPLVYGAVLRFEGQVAVFDPAGERGVNPCYRCLFPRPPDATDAPDCATAGVLGVLPGLVGTVQATEAIKLILGLGRPLIGRLLRIEALDMCFLETVVHADPECAYCAPGAAFPGYVDYQAFCQT